ncbi:MAG: MFS transporter, partial [bacterium]|nr:MFS transporter [bacterium]
MPSAGTQGKLFYGWWVVIACAIVHLYSAATFFYGFGALFNPIVEEFAWSYALVSFAVSLRGFESGAFAPIVGMFVDKLGPRKLVLCGIAVLGLGFVFLGNIKNLWGFYAVFVFMAFGFSLMSLVVTMTAVARWFGHRSGLAMGVLTTGFGAGGLLLPAVVWVVDQLGWRPSV